MPATARPRPPIRLVVVLLAGLLLSACAAQPEPAAAPAATDAPADADEAAAGPVDNCGFEVEVAAPPTRAVTMNQAATEVLLSLGLTEQMAGTAYLDDGILPALAEDYDEVPVLADAYPSREVLLEAEPDFVYGSYASAFAEEAAGPRQDLDRLGIDSYLSPAACEERTGALTFDDVAVELTEVAGIFDVPDRGEALVEEHRARIATARDAVAATPTRTVFWWDGGDDAPTAGGCCGAPGMILEALGLDNAFGDVDGSWGTVSWEQVLERDPDVIVLVDADWDPAEDKRAVLDGDTALRDLRAVQTGQLVELPFSSTTPGVRNVEAVEELAEAIAAAAR